MLMIAGLRVQIVVSGEGLCSRQIVTVSNNEGRVIVCSKPFYPAVWSV